MATSDEMLNKMNEAIGVLQSAQQTVVQGAERLGNAVHKSGDESIAGKKTFSASPQVPTAASGDSSTNAANTAFVANAVAMGALNSIHKTGNETISGIKTFTASPIVPEPNEPELTSKQAAPVSWVRDMLRAEVEKMSSGRNTVVRDKNDNPHVMVVIPRFNVQDIDTSLGTGPHPAFIVNGQVKSEILIGKYIASKSSNGLAQTLPHRAPWCSINFDAALAACRALGPNFGLCTNAMYSARSLWLMKNLGEHEYLGNTNWGRSHTNPWQTGVMQTNAFNPGDTGNNVTAATLTGTGPEDWNDDGTAWGISDYVGNVWEWSAGLRINAGEINIIPDNDAILANANHAANSASWKAISSTGALVAPGTSNTLKYDAKNAGGNGDWKYMGEPIMTTQVVNQTKNDYCYVEFKNLNPLSGLTVPALAKLLGLYPAARDGSLQGYIWTASTGERLPLRGASWASGLHSGPFALGLHVTRAGSYWAIGFRAAFVS